MAEPSVLERLVRDLVDERRRERRWRIFFRLVGVAIIVPCLAALVVVIGAKERVCLNQCTALVEIRGELDAGSRASAQRIIGGMQAAVKHRGIKGLVLRISSPGGSPVQAGQVHDEVLRLRALHPQIPIHAVVEETAASGAYYIAAAADQVFVDRASVVGSIGVIMAGFGFTGAMEKLGVERRLLAAGQNKALLDPFSPADPKQRAQIQSMLDDIHAQFIAAVRAGRGSRLKENPEMFSGMVWNGQRAVELGLADALGSVQSVARDVIRAEEILDFTLEDDLADRFARRLGAVLATAMLASGQHAPVPWR